MLLAAIRHLACYFVQLRLVVKVFDKDHRTEHRKAKLDLLISHELELHGIGFPTAIITNSDGDFVGYAMPRASGKELQATIMRPARFRRVYPTWTKADLVDVCISFLEKVAYLHSLNILLGDINPKNLMVDENKNVWIIDADSWQVEGYPCPVGTAMFTASSITGDYAEALRTVEEERFAVATMLFMILITGQFPYARAGADGGDFVALIKEGKFAFQFQGASDQDQAIWYYTSLLRSVTYCWDSSVDSDASTTSDCSSTLASVSAHADVSNRLEIMSADPAILVNLAFAFASSTYFSHG